MKITRFVANRAFRMLGSMALGYLEEDILEATTMNMLALRKVVNDLEALKKELFVRLYGNPDNMDEEQSKRLADFFDILSKMKGPEQEKTDELEALARESFPDLYKLRKKELNVITSLLNKEVEVDLVPIDEKKFIKGILKGKQTAQVNDICLLFGFMFIQEADEETNLSELDEIL